MLLRVRSTGRARKVGERHLARGVARRRDALRLALVDNLLRQGHRLLGAEDIRHEDDGETGLHVPTRAEPSERENLAQRKEATGTHHWTVQQEKRTGGGGQRCRRLEREHVCALWQWLWVVQRESQLVRGLGRST